MPRSGEKDESRAYGHSKGKRTRRYARKLPRVNNAATVIQRWWRLQQYRANARSPGRRTKPRPAMSVQVPEGSGMPSPRRRLNEWVQKTNDALSPHTSTVGALQHVELPGGSSSYTAGRYASPRVRERDGSSSRPSSSKGPETPRSGSTQRLHDILRFLDNVGENDDEDPGTVNPQSPLTASAQPSVLNAATELEISEQGKIIVMLRESLKEQRAQEERRIKKLHHAFKTRTVSMQKEHESALARQLDLVDRLVKDKTDLSAQCEKLTHEMSSLDKRLERRVETLREEHALEMKRQKDIWAAGEKIRKEQFIAAKTKEIRDTTIKGLEPEVQRLIGKHKNDQQKWQRELEQQLLSQELQLKKLHQTEIENLRAEMAKQRDAALEQERAQLQERLTSSTLDTEEQLREQMKRFTVAREEERRRHDAILAEQKEMFEAQVARLQQVQDQALKTQKEHYEESLRLAKERQASTVEQQRANDELERKAWEESKRQELEHIMATETQALKERLTKERDEQINVVLLKLKEKSEAQARDNEQHLERRLDAQRAQFENEMDALRRTAEDANRARDREASRADDLQSQVNQARAEISLLESRITSLQEELAAEAARVRAVSADLAHAQASTADEVARAIANYKSELEAVKKDLVACEAQAAKRAKDHERELRQLVQRKAQELDTVHEKVRATIQKKDDRIEALQKRVTEEVAKQQATLKLLEKQRAAYLQ